MFAPMLTRIRSARAIWRDLATKDNLEKRCDKGYHFSDPEAEPLCAPEQADSQSQPRAISLRLRAIPYIFHFVLVCIYTGIFLYSQRGREQCAKEKWNEIVQSPASSAVIYESSFFNASLCIDSPYIGKPSPQSDQAWTDLLHYSHVRVSGEDLQRINKTSIPLPGEENAYWATLGVTHELHCLKRIRQYIYKDYYFSDSTKEQEVLNAIHTDHCLEILRQATMCRGDVSLITMYWEENTPIPAADFAVPHSCVNWDAIQTWAKDRAIDPMKPGYLHHPTLGASFPDGMNHGIGVSEMQNHHHDMLKLHDSGCPPLM